jgi:5-methylcytosine-specific restriction enzyme subunit McrC
MKPITVFEHKGIYGLSDANKRVLDHLRGPRNERLFEVGWSEVRATSFVGVVQLPQVTLQILPKMHRTGLPAAECEHEATLNLLFLLSYTRKLDVTEPEIALLTEQRAPLSEILYWIFARRLWEAVQREVLRGYVTHEARLGVMKGRWLVAAQCRRSDGWRRDLFDVAYDEFTEDNLPNRLFKATVEWLSRRANWSDTQRYLTQLRAAFTDVTDYAPRLEDFTEAVRWMVRYRRRAGAGALSTATEYGSHVLHWCRPATKPRQARQLRLSFRHESTFRGIHC